jgi:hypothetical protein
MKYFQITITGMLAVPEHVQDPEYWEWTSRDVANRISGLTSSGEGTDIHDFEIDIEPLTTSVGPERINNAMAQLEEVHANDWHKHEGGCACLE